MLLHHHFVRTARKFSSKTAFIDRSANRVISYSRALAASLVLAKKFESFNRGCIGIMIPTSAGAALAVLGVLMSGRTPVMINYSTGAGENAEYAKLTCRFSTIITSRALLEKIDCPKLGGMVFLEDILASVTWQEKVRAGFLARLPVTVILKQISGESDQENAVILFTSGSEKTPKAVQLTHRNILSNITGFSEGFGFGPDDKMLGTLPYFHVFGLNTNLWLPLVHGMTLVTYANPVDYRTVSNIVREEKPTLMVGTPSFYWGYLVKSEPGDYGSIRIAAVGADKCPDSLKVQFQEKHNIRLYEGYGTTETSPVISANNPRADRPGSVGRPLSSVRVRIQNHGTGNECRPNEIGMIMVKGNSVMKGYYGDMKQTSLSLINGWYTTGDMGYLDEDGYLWHAGRLKRFVKIAGEMISLVRVEDVLSRLLPRDCECCVVGVVDETKGARIHAAITQVVDEPRLIKRLSEQLPRIAVPRSFHLFDELPKLGSGKVDFRATTDLVIGNMNNRNKETLLAG